MTRNVIFWLDTNQSLISVDQIPGAIADARYPPLPRDELPGQASNDPNTFPRLVEERLQAKRFRAKFPNLPDGSSFSIGDISAYLADLGLVAETKIRSDTLLDTDSHGTEGRWSKRQFIDGFNSVREGTTESRKSHTGVSNERCIELAASPELYVDHFKELVGIGIGPHESYVVGNDGVTFRKWEDDFIASSPNDWELEMLRDNRTAPQLTFPCTTAELLTFVDTAIGIHCFMVPDAFRMAVERAAPVLTEATKPNGPASVETGKKKQTNAEPVQKAPKKPGVTKAEILGVDWPLPTAAPPLENILDKIPKWVEEACNKIGQPGKGQSGSHLWNPAMLAVCLANRTPHKKWVCHKQALTNFITANFSDYLSEWEEKSELL